MSPLTISRRRVGAAGSAAALVGGAGSALALALLASPVGATPVEHVVDTLDDGSAQASDCTSHVANSCSLRDAIAAASSGDLITFASGLTGTITLTDGELQVSEDIVIRGPGAASVTVDANAASRVFYIRGEVEIVGLTITGGLDSQGGGLYNEGSSTLTLREVVVTDNEASLSPGGGVKSSGPLVVIDSVISDNRVARPDHRGAGGGIAASDSLAVVRSTVSGNSSTGNAGGIYAYGALTIAGSTISDNSTQYCGAGVAFYGPTALIVDTLITGNSGVRCGGGGLDLQGEPSVVTIANTTITGNSNYSGGGIRVGMETTLNIFMSTITDNTATNTGGQQYADALYSGAGIHSEAGGSYPVYNPVITIVGSIVSGNHSASGDISSGGNGSFQLGVSSDDSIIGTVSARIDLTATNTIRTSTPGLRPLADNGGHTRTMALDPESPAVDAGPATVPTFTYDAYDQRGAGYLRVVGTRSDIGAFEIQAEPQPSTTTTTSTTAPVAPVVPTFTG